MLTSIRGLTAASFATGLALSAAPALAETIDIESYDPVAANSNISFEIADSESAIDLDRALAEIDVEAASKIGAESDITLSANVALVTDYRFRGVSLSGGDPAG